MKFNHRSAHGLRKVVSSGKRRPKSRRKSFARNLQIESLESRALLAAVSWITAALAHDTGSSADGLTADDTVSGNVTAGTTVMKAGFDSTKATKFVDVSAALQAGWDLRSQSGPAAPGGGRQTGRWQAHVAPAGQRRQRQRLAQFNLAFTLDTAAPTITAALAKDTGSSAKDGITYDDTVNGKATDTNAIAGLTAGFDAAGPASFVDVSAGLKTKGAFTLTPALMAQAAGGALADGRTCCTCWPSTRPAMCRPWPTCPLPWSPPCRA